MAIKYLIQDGTNIKTMGIETIETIGTGVPTEEQFLNSGFDSGIIIGNDSIIISMQDNGALGTGKMYSRKLPNYFDDIDNLTISK